MITQPLCITEAAGVARAAVWQLRQCIISLLLGLNSVHGFAVVSLIILSRQSIISLLLRLNSVHGFAAAFLIVLFVGTG